MMFHATLPLKYWVDCFLAIIYWINQLPSFNLNMKALYAEL